MRYRKKPVVIEAIHAQAIISAYNNGGHEYEDLPQWVIDAYESGVIVAITTQHFTIATLEGDHLALPTDMVIRGVQGELYPCKPDIFSATYEPVTDPNPKQ